MKKFRGKKRYFRNLWKEIYTLNIRSDKEAWFDFWHIHLDFCGIGNHNLRVRREHIKAQIALYNKILKALETFEKPFQAWICIHEEDTGSDAVYIHTTNPNSDYFPHKLKRLNWNCNLPNTFKDLIDINKFNVAYYESEFEETYYIQSKDKGIKL